jgi:hypothetical protein
MTPRAIPLRALCALALALAALAANAGGAAAHVTPAQAQHAVDRGAIWFETNQEESGDLGSDWAMTALAAAGINAADVRTSLADPSAQDFYLGDWQANGPGGAGTDAARGILAGVAGGIQVSRLSTDADATRSNLVARLAELFDGTQVGSASLLNDDIFAVLALHQAGAPAELLGRLVDYLRTKQLADGGWSWSASPSASSDIDMTGSVLAAFCASGVGPEDPALQQAIALLHTMQDPATGGFVAPPPFGVGVNTDTTAWVVSGLIQCGIDPQGPDWTTAQGKTPLDYLVSMQRPDGHFDWTDEFGGGSFETYSAVRPLAGVGFSSAPPARLDGASPAVRPVADPADGTLVPVTLVIDHGPAAGDVRMCRVDVEAGADLSELLGDAENASTPAGCVGAFAAHDGSDGVDVDSVNGVGENANYGWRVQVDGSPAATASNAPVGFGDLVFLALRPLVANSGRAPDAAVPPLGAAPRPKALRPRVAIRGRAGWSGEAVAISLGCPRGLGEGGCRGLLSAQFRARAEGGLLEGGSAVYEIASGQRQRVELSVSAALRQRLAEAGRLKLRLTAATRSPDGAVRVTHAKRFLRG